MAAGKPQNGTNGDGAPKPPGDEYTKIVTGHEGWVKFIQNEAIHGKIVGYQERYDKDGYEYLLKLLAPAKGTKDKKEIVHPVGAVVALNETAQLAGELRFYVESRATVWINPEEKVKASKGNVWRLDIRVKGPKSNQLPSALIQSSQSGDSAESGDGTSDDVPF